MDKRIVILLLILFKATLGFGQDSWKLKIVEDGIKVYTRSVTNSKIKAIKVECNLAAKPSQLVAVILDINTSCQWVYQSKTAKVLKQVSPAELYYYCEVNVPWPAKNRDFVSHVRVSQDADNKVVTIDAPCVPNMVLVKENIVRITNSVGKWTIAPIENKKIKVQYELMVDPAGTIPAWLVNLFVTQGPLETFERLKVQLRKPEYKEAKFSFIRD